LHRIFTTLDRLCSAENDSKWENGRIQDRVARKVLWKKSPKM
jgi:hypothetical protein